MSRTSGFARAEEAGRRSRCDGFRTAVCPSIDIDQFRCTEETTSDGAMLAPSGNVSLDNRDDAEAASVVRRNREHGLIGRVELLPRRHDCARETDRAGASPSSTATGHRPP